MWWGGGWTKDPTLVVLVLCLFTHTSQLTQEKHRTADMRHSPEHNNPTAKHTKHHNDDLPPLNMEDAQYTRGPPRSDQQGCQTHSRHVVMSDEKHLIRYLLEDYAVVGTNGRPVINMSTTIHVEFGLGLIQMDLDEKYKVLKMSMWARYKWKDEYLRWDPADFNGVATVRLSSNLLWLPDIMLYNSADPKSELRDVLAVVDNNGTVMWIPHQVFKSSCSLDVTNFPFDNQNCHMWFGSWTHTMREVDVHMAFKAGIDLSTFQSDYLESSDWEINSTVAEKKILPHDNDTNAYAVLTFQLSMRRKLVFASYILTLPCVFLACLTLVVFWLPPDRPDRTALAMSIFASFLVLLLILVEAAPPTASSVPVLGVYYCFNMVIIMMSVFLSSLVVNVCRAGESRRNVPKWLKKLTLDWVGRILFMSSNYEHSKEYADTCGDPDTVIRNEGMRRTSSLLNLDKYGRERHVRVTCNGAFDPKYQTTVEPGEIQSLVDGQMQDMKKSLSHIKSNLLERTRVEWKQQQNIRIWRDVALVIDRVFFLLYILLIVVSLATLFPRRS